MKPTGKCRCIWPRPMIPRKLVGFYAWVCRRCGKVKAISTYQRRFNDIHTRAARSAFRNG